MNTPEKEIRPIIPVMTTKKDTLHRFESLKVRSLGVTADCENLSQKSGAFGAITSTSPVNQDRNA